MVKYNKKCTFAADTKKLKYMPRKESGMWYEVHRTPVKGEDGQNIVYVRPKSGMKLNMKQLEDYCERMNYLRYGELSRVMDAFVRVAGRFLAEGYRIDTPIGSFAPKLSLAKQLTDADQVKDRDVRLEGVGVEFYSKVKLLRNGETREREVTIGARNDTDVEIVKGLEAGDEVVIGEAKPGAAQ